MSMENVLHATAYGAGTASAADPDDGVQLNRRTPSTGIAVPANGIVSPITEGAAPRGRSLVPRSGIVMTNGASSNPAKRARKDRGPNWSAPEIIALVIAKRDMYLEELDVVDERDLMNPDATKWIRISLEVMRAGFSPCPHDGPACKSKWNQIIPEYKRIADFFTRSGTNGIEYWNMTAKERKNEGLPRSFSQDTFNNIHEWYQNRPSMQPPHTRDLLSTEDSNYIAPQRHSEGGHEHCDSDAENEDPMDFANLVELNDDTPGIFPSPLAPASTANACFSSPTVMPSPSRRNGLPPGVKPLVVNSNDMSASTLRRKEGNTRIRRKHLSGHNVITETTKASGDVIAGEMRQMAEASRDLERSKIEVQLKLFSEQMEYQRERDRRLHDNAQLANMNAKLAVEKQGQVVKCLSDLSNVLSAGLRLPKVVQSGPEVQKLPHDTDQQKDMAANAALDLLSINPVTTGASTDTTLPGL